nr:hypothetical protein [Tanacetum cinerariifolium]
MDNEPNEVRDAIIRQLRTEKEKEYQLVNNLLGEINHYILQKLDRTEEETRTTRISIFLLTVLLIPMMEYHICTLVNVKNQRKDNTRTNGYSSKGVALKNKDVMEGGHDNVMPTQEYVRKVIEDVSKDDHFMCGPWLRAVVYLHVEGVIAYGCLGDMKIYYKNGKLERVVGVVMTCTPNAFGDITITLKYPSGTMGGSIKYKVFQHVEGYARSIKVGVVLILRNVSVFTPKPSNHYLNITLRNIVKVFDKDT